jgi:nucleotide-binding universal stress UspA family protein
MSRLMLGSIAAKVVAQSPVPVLVARADAAA